VPHLGNPVAPELGIGSGYPKSGNPTVCAVEILAGLALEILGGRFPINLRPTPAIQRALNNPRFQILSPDCVVSRADAHFAEIPANPLAWLVPGSGQE
jgi:hypothetical protein